MDCRDLRPPQGCARRGGRRYRQGRRHGRSHGARCLERNGCEKVAKEIVAKHGRIDLLVNSAGVNVPKRSWDDITTEGWDKLVDINLSGVMYCMRAVLPAMRAQKDGVIINVASWAGRHVSKMTGPAYTTTKHAVLALTHSFNMDEFKNGCARHACRPAKLRRRS
jgi:NAD(P)-dependent dehydrogenase (short-subunit alcohol dehydrogenase family)